MQKEKRKILLIEDDFNIRTNLSELLEVNNFDIISLADGKSAVTIAKGFQPDLILCDIMLPCIDGYEILKLVRAEKSISLVPFLFLSAKADLSDIRSGMEIGADDYITKPFDAQRLLNAIEARLARVKQLMNSQKSPVLKNSGDGNKRTIFINDRTNPRFVKINEVLAIEANAKYTFLYLQNEKKILFNKTLKAWENELPSNSFIRIHRSYIINHDYIEKIIPWFKKSFKVKLKGLENEFFISERFAAVLKKNNLI